MSYKIAISTTIALSFIVSILMPPLSAAATAQSPSPSTGRYVALGDSVAAGDGLPLNGSLYSQCRQSDQGYPQLVAQRAGLSLTNVSCSGATVGDLVTAQRIDNAPNVPAQLKRAFATGVPDVMTLTAGANDVQWNRFIAACYQYDCTDDSYTAAARGLVLAMRVKLDYALNSIERRSAGDPPRVVVTGYYNPLSTACAAVEPRLTKAELRWLTKQSNALNKAIRAEVRDYDFAKYVSISFSGHDLCSSDSWIQGLTAAAPLHPTAKGQEYIARRVVSALK